jgi:hypothetical protein
MKISYDIGGDQPFGHRSRTPIGARTASDGCYAACFQSMTTAIQAFCSRSKQSRYGAQPRSRSFRDTSAASAVSETVNPALTRPFEDSTNTWRRRCGIAQTSINCSISPLVGSRIGCPRNGMQLFRKTSSKFKERQPVARCAMSTSNDSQRLGVCTPCRYSNDPLGRYGRPLRARFALKQACLARQNLDTARSTRHPNSSMD